MGVPWLLRQLLLLLCVVSHNNPYFFILGLRGCGADGPHRSSSPPCVSDALSLAAIVTGSASLPVSCQPLVAAQQRFASRPISTLASRAPTKDSSPLGPTTSRRA